MRKEKGLKSTTCQFEYNTGFPQRLGIIGFNFPLAVGSIYVEVVLLASVSGRLDIFLYHKNRMFGNRKSAQRFL